jgi:gliding motility-associated-like protein
MKKLLSLLILSATLFVGSNSYAQITLTNTTSTNPASMDVCGGLATFTYTINNVSNFDLSNNQLLFNLPQGLAYIPGSINGATENNISDLNQPIFTFSDLLTGSVALIFTFQAEVGCGAIPFLQQGNTYQNAYVHSYNYGGGQFNSETHTGASYNVQYPFVVITNVTNQSYAADVGDSYQQCVSIINTGQATLDHLWFINDHGVDLSTANYSPGAIQSSGAGFDSLLLAASDFTAFGNGDNLFDPGETVIICYDVTVNGCDDVNSDLYSTWGCNNEFCQTTSSTANVTFPNLIPILTFNITQNTSDACLGNADTYSITIENIGSGGAYNVLLDIFNHANGNQTNNYLGYLVPGSFTYSLNGNPSQPVITNDLNTNNVFGCVPANSPSEVESVLPVLNPGDIIVVTFQQFLCCPDFCAPQHNLPGLGFTGYYENICGFAYTEPFVQIFNYDRIYASMYNDNSPSTATGGQSTLMNFGINPAGNWFPNGPGASWVAEYTIPSCSVWDGQSFFTLSNGNNVLPDSTIVNGTTITSYYPMPMNIHQGTFHVGFIPDCDTLAGCMQFIAFAPIPCVGIVTNVWAPINPQVVMMQLYYIPDNTCGCLVNLCNFGIEINLDCPTFGGTFTPIDGISCQEFSFERTSYGLPDNNNDGQPDVGPLNMSLIRTDRAVYGDTVTASAYGIVDTINGNSNYQYFLAKMLIVEGENITYVGGNIDVYDNSTGTYFTEFIPVPTVTTTSPDSYFEFELDATTFVNAPPGFVFDQDDTIWSVIDYRVTTNPGNSIDLLEATNIFFVTNNPLAVDTSGACSCTEDLSIFGYYFTIYGENTLFVSECDSVKFTENYYLSVGPCCTNYAGGNAFRYEYRNFATLDTMEIILPAGYIFSSARIRERHGTGNATSTWSAWQPLVPTATIAPIWFTQWGGSHIKFATDQFYTNGSFLYPDEGFYGTLEVYCNPSCEVEQDVQKWVGYAADFDTDTLWWDSPTSTTVIDVTRDKVTYNGADLFIQASLPSIQTGTNTATWTVTISNISSVAGSNIFLAIQNLSGNLIVNDIYDVNAAASIPNNGGNIFPIGDIPVAATWEFIITADVNGCGLDSLIVYAGWNCTGTPPDLQSYPCLNTTPFIVLSVLPLEPFLITQVASSVDSIGLCDVSSIEIEGENIQLGWAYDMDLTVNLPPGVSIVPGSAVACYPAGSANCFNIPDPTFIGNSQYLWDSLIFNGIIGLTGMPGFDSTYNNIGVTFDITTDCNYTSGSFISAGFQGYAGCGDLTGEEISGSPPIFIENSVIPFNAQIFMSSQSLSPCEDSTLLEVWVTNYGPVDFGPLDSVTIILPDGFYYVPGSTININSGPTNLTPSVSVFGTDTYLTWPIPAISPGDSTYFSIYYQGDPAMLTCQAVEISSYSTTVNNLLCTNTGNNCSFNVIVTDTSTFVFIYKGFLELANASSNSVAGPGNNETVSFNFDIINFGNTINANYGTVVNYYSDSNYDGFLDPGDVLLSSNTYNVLLDSNTTTNFLDTLVVPAGLACQIIIEISNVDNICSCLSDTVIVIPDFSISVMDTSVCTDIPIDLGDPGVAGYFYFWITQDPQYGGVLDTIWTPTPTATWSTGITQNPDTILFTFYAYRGNGTFFPFNNQCFVVDTVSLIVYPEPLVDAGNDTLICNYDIINLDGSTLSFTDSTYWTQLSGPSALSFADVSDTITSVSGFAAGTYQITLTGTSVQCNNDIDTLVIIVNDPLLSEINLINVSCYNAADGQIEIGASLGIPIYQYSMNGAAFGNQVLYTGLDTGQYTFVLIDSLGCLDTLVSIITEPDTLTIDFDSTNVSCSYTQDGSIDAIVTGGTLNYNYAWSDGQNTSTASNLDVGTFTVTVTDANGCVTIDSTSVLLLYPDPIVDAGPDDTLCFYDQITLDGSVLVYYDSIYWTQLSGPSTLNFSNINDTNATVTGFNGGTYQIMLTGANFACTDIYDTLIVTSIDPLLTEQSLTNVSCFNATDGSIDILASNGLTPYLYSVNGSAFSPTVNYTNLDIGNYEFIVQDAFGCLDTLNSVITQPDTLTIAFTPSNISCSGLTDGSIDALVNGGTPNYNYAWSNGQVSSTAANLDSGTYVLTVTDANGCITIDSSSITTPPAIVVIEIVDSVICNGNSDGNINISVTGGTPGYSFLWNGTVNTEDVLNVTAGQWNLLVTDLNGCTYTNSYDIFEPTAIVAVSALTDENCENDCLGSIDITSISGGTGNSYTILYQGNNVGGTQLFNNLCDGDYAINIIDQNGCSVDYVYTINPGLAFPDAAFDVLPIMCAYDTTVIINPVNNTGDWTMNGVNSGISFNPSIIGSGSYLIEHIIPGICPDTFSLNITINSIPVPNIWASELVVCIPDGIELENIGDTGVSCYWNLNGSTSTNCGPFTYTSPTPGFVDVSLTVIDTNGCAANQTIPDYLYFADSPTAMFYADPPQTSFYDPLINLINTSSGASTYEWLIDNSPYSTDQNSWYSHSDGPAVFNVTLIATNDYGCTDTVQGNIEYLDEPSLYVPNTFTPEGNSFNNTFFPVGINIEIVDWYIFNRWGEAIFHSQNLGDQWDGSYNGVLVADGVYVYKITYLEENSELPKVVYGHVTVLK